MRSQASNLFIIVALNTGLWQFEGVRVLLTLGLALTVFAASAADRKKLAIEDERSFRGMCDASAGVPLSEDLFIAANDEDNTLRLYRAGQGGAPLREYPLDSFLEVEGKSLEADIEGGALIGKRAFWIGSHGRNRVGKERLNRCRLFATDIVETPGRLSQLLPVGRPYKHLLDDLFQNSRFSSFHLEEAAGLVPKEEDALNIEGLAATPDNHLLIGFRNPIPRGQALIIPLLNPDEVVTDGKAAFDAAITLDLGGLGIRDMTLLGRSYLIIAGAYDGKNEFKLYRWSGERTAKPELLKVNGLKRYHSEALISFPLPGLDQCFVLSDDGALLSGGTRCKDIKIPALRSFRGFWVRGQLQ